MLWSITWAYPRFKKWGRTMASARKRAVGWDVTRGVPSPPDGAMLPTPAGRGLCPSPEKFRFLSSNGEFWRIPGANVIAVELPVLHA